MNRSGIRAKIGRFTRPMGTVIELCDKKTFCSALVLVSEIKTVVVALDEQMLIVFTLAQPYIFLKIPAECYRTSGPATFSVDPSILLSHINTLPSNVAIISDVFRIVDSLIIAEDERPVPNDALYDHLINIGICDKISENTDLEGVKWYSYVDIPIGPPFASPYRTGVSYTTRLILEKDILGYILQGRVCYSNGRNGLEITKNERGYLEEMVLDAKYLAKGYLNVSCSNDCFRVLKPFSSSVNTILMCFSDEMVSVKASFSTSPVIFEAQVPCYLHKNFL